jgi:hypothetical protein
LEHGLQSAQIPFVRNNEIEVVMGIERAVLIDYVGLALDVGNEQLRSLSQSRVDAIYCPVPVRGGFLRNVTLRNLMLARFEIAPEAWIVMKIHKATFIHEGIDYSEPPPFD